VDILLGADILKLTRPDRDSHLAEVGGPQEIHIGAGLADTAGNISLFGGLFRMQDLIDIQIKCKWLDLNLKVFILYIMMRGSSIATASNGYRFQGRVLYGLYHQ
jgi:hypothetical protein